MTSAFAPGLFKSSGFIFMPAAPVCVLFVPAASLPAGFTVLTSAARVLAAEGIAPRCFMSLSVLHVTRASTVRACPPAALPAALAPGTKTVRAALGFSAFVFTADFTVPFAFTRATAFVPVLALVCGFAPVPLCLRFSSSRCFILLKYDILSSAHHFSCATHCIFRANDV